MLLDQDFGGDISDDILLLDQYSRDSSLFEVTPKLVVSPKNTNDLKILVSAINELIPSQSFISLTARANGTDMTGGPLSDSVIIDFSKYLTRTSQVSNTRITVQAGANCGVVNKIAGSGGLIMPAYPANSDYCSIGGMIANNSGGEASYKYGKTERYVANLSVILSDGQEYQIKPITKQQLVRKMSQQDFEGKIYKQIFNLIEDNYDVIKDARPLVKRNSAGYNLWDVWDRDSGIFDLTKLFVGSQGTLGLIVDATLDLVPAWKYTEEIVCTLDSLDNLDEILAVAKRHDILSIECFDDTMLATSLRHYGLFKRAHGNLVALRQVIEHLSDSLRIITEQPRLVVLFTLASDKKRLLQKNCLDFENDLHQIGVSTKHHSLLSGGLRTGYLRRWSYDVLRDRAKQKYCLPMVDDFAVPVDSLQSFIPKARRLLKQHAIPAIIVGHLGDGNFHVVPITDVMLHGEEQRLVAAMSEISNISLKHGGTLSGEHNDGLSKSPWLAEQYGEQVFKLFSEIKRIFDPQNIFNPHKKTDSSWEYSSAYVQRHF